MNWRPELEDQALRSVFGLSPGAFDLLVRTLARICDDPYARLFSKPLGGDPRERMAELGDWGYVEFTIDDSVGVIRVHRLMWAG